MGFKRKEKAAILIKVEPEYGVDAAPVPGTDTIICSKPEFGVISESRERNVVIPYFGKLAAIKVGTGLEVSFDVQVQTSGALGVAPLIGRALRACNFTQTINDGVSVVYTPHSELEGESVTIYVYQDGYLHKILGAVGDWSKAAHKCNDMGVWSFKFTGLYSGAELFAVESPLPALTYPEKDVIPALFRNANFLMHDFAAVIENFNFQLGNKVSKRVDANAATGISRYFISDRETKGDCDPEAGAYDDFNPWKLWEDGTPGALASQLGATPGNIIEFAMPRIVAGEVPKYGEREGLLTYAYGFGCHPDLDNGNDELTVTFR
jgi:hypothetical protein